MHDDWRNCLKGWTPLWLTALRISSSVPCGYLRVESSDRVLSEGPYFHKWCSSFSLFVNPSENLWRVFCCGSMAWVWLKKWLQLNVLFISYCLATTWQMLWCKLTVSLPCLKDQQPPLIYVCVCVCVCVYVYIYIYIYIYTHTYIYVCVCVCVCLMGCNIQPLTLHYSWREKRILKWCLTLHKMLWETANHWAQNWVTLLLWLSFLFRFSRVHSTAYWVNIWLAVNVINYVKIESFLVSM